jgi:hypothetical protein
MEEFYSPSFHDTEQLSSTKRIKTQNIDGGHDII